MPGGVAAVASPARRGRAVDVHASHREAERRIRHEEAARRPAAAHAQRAVVDDARRRGARGRIGECAGRRAEAAGNGVRRREGLAEPVVGALDADHGAVPLRAVTGEAAVMDAGRIRIAQRRDRLARPARLGGKRRDVRRVVGEVDARHAHADMAADVEAVPARAAGCGDHGVRAAQHLAHIGRVRLQPTPPPQHRKSTNACAWLFPHWTTIHRRSSGINLNVALAAPLSGAQNEDGAGFRPRRPHVRPLRCFSLCASAAGGRPAAAGRAGASSARQASGHANPTRGRCSRPAVRRRWSTRRWRSR